MNWPSFGNTLDQNRYSPLTQITPANVDQLGRAFTVDLNKFVPGIKKGQQTYPIVVNGTMYITSGDDQVFAVNAATGALLWHYAPEQRRHLQELRDRREPRRRLLRQPRVPAHARHDDRRARPGDRASSSRASRSRKAVPGALRELRLLGDSAPICADNHLIVGAAGSEYGARGFVMAYNTPTSPRPGRTRSGRSRPNNTEWRRRRAHRRRRRRCGRRRRSI